MKNSDEMIAKIIAFFLLFMIFLAFAVVLFLFQAWILMMAWNVSMPLLFDFPTIGMKVSAGIVFMLGIVGGFFRRGK